MAIKVCPNGHHYNTDDNLTCPYCERESGSDNNYDWTAVDVTEQSETSISSRNKGGTVIIPTNGNNNRGYQGNTEPIGIGSINNADSDNGGKTVPLKPMGYYPNNHPESVPDPEKTEPGWGESGWGSKEYSHQPVVGWLVCIEGPDKGKDFSLHGAKTSIGRKKDSSIRLADPKISRDGYPALIVYDDRKTHRFYLASGDASSRNNVELGGNMLLGQSIINPYDEIRIEDTVLVFVPFCGDDFNWSEDN